MKIDNQIKYWAMLCEGEEEFSTDNTTITEGLKNKLLSWIGMRSNYEKLEDFVDKVASGQAKDKDARSLMDQIDNDDKFIELRKSLPKRFTEDDLKPTIIDILNDKMNKKASDKRYKKAIDVLSKVLYRSIISDREEYANDEREFQEKMRKEKEKERKEREAEYARKHPVSYSSGAYEAAHRGSSSARWSEPDYMDDQFSENQTVDDSEQSQIVMLFRTSPNIDDNAGKITFSSLDEMKNFIASIGGEYSKEIEDGFTQG